MKKNFMLIAALAMVLFFAAPITSEAAEEAKGTWKEDTTGWWYEFADGTYYKDGFYEIDGLTYYFDEVGYMATGWEKVAGDWYYFYPSGNMLTGWADIKGVWYYFDEYGMMYENGSWYVDETLYLFARDGAWMGTPGWNKLQYDKYETEIYDWYYLDAKGVVQTKWQMINGKWYYFEEDFGYMYSNGKYMIDDVEYMLDANGAWVENAGWNYAGGWYYLNANNEYAKGWQAINGEWYYFGEDGLMYEGGRHQILEGEEYKTYFFEYGGAMVDGWYNYASKLSKYGNWVYCDASGKPADKWLELAGNWYYFSDGYMLRDQWIEDEDDEDVKYFLGLDGAMVKGWYHDEYSDPHYKEDYRWIYTDPATGAAYDGWLQISGKWYYISDGVMLRSGAEIAAKEAKRPEYPQWEEYAGPDYIMSDEEREAFDKALDAYYKAEAEYYDLMEDYWASIYVFDDNGAMVTGGWYKYQSSTSETWYYATADGKAYDGWLEYRGQWYYLDGGRMLTNCYIEGYWIGADGVWVK